MDTLLQTPGLRAVETVCLNTAVSLVMRSTIMREGLRTLLTRGGMLVEPVPFDGEIQSVIPALRESGGADLVILDGSLCGRPSQLLSSLRRALPEPRIVVMTDSVGLSGIAEEEIGVADGILTPDLPDEAIIQSLFLVKLGSQVVSRPSTVLSPVKYDPPQEVSYRPNTASDPISHPLLTPRENEILSCLLSGYSNKVIARHLNIAEGTVKVHIKGLLRKIRVANRTQAAMWAVNNGIAPLCAGAAGKS